MRARLLRRLAPALVAALAAAACASPAQAYRLDGIPWPGRPATITYWNGTGYTAQVKQAAAAWNRSGARVRFVPAPRRRAALRIVYDPRPVPGVAGLAHGSASVGYQPHNRIALGRGAHGVGAVGVIAHELGHVLGLVHEDRRCATMNSVAWSRCALPPSCSILQRDDVRGAIARYGGRREGARAGAVPARSRGAHRRARPGLRPDSRRDHGVDGDRGGRGDRAGCGRPLSTVVRRHRARAARRAGRVLRAGRHAGRPVRRPRRRNALRARMELRRHRARQRVGAHPADRAPATCARVDDGCEAHRTRSPISLWSADESPSIAAPDAPRSARHGGGEPGGRPGGAAVLGGPARGDRHLRNRWDVPEGHGHPGRRPARLAAAT